MAGMQRELWWALTANGIPDLWIHEMGDEAVVAVIDTGIIITPDFPRERIIATFNAIDDTDIVIDVNGHGSTCAGIIGGSGEELIRGVAPECKFIIVKAKPDLNPIPEVNIDNAHSPERQAEIQTQQNEYDLERERRVRAQINYLSKAFEWLETQASVDIISISVSVPSDIKYQQELNRFQEAINRCVQQGKVIVGSIGNFPIARAPGMYPNVIAPGCIDMQGTPFRKLLIQPQLMNCWAAGTNVNFYPEIEHDGVSFSTAFVAGVLALSISRHKKRNGTAITAEAVAQRIENTALEKGRYLGRRGILNVPRLFESPI